MSAGLQNEVTALLGARLAVRAADQAYTGDKQVYTNIKPCTSTCGPSGGGSSDPVTAAIERARQIAQNALGGGVPDSTKVLSEIATLRKEVSGLHADLASIKSLLQQLTLQNGGSAAVPAAKAQPAQPAASAKEEAEADEDFDLFGDDDSEDEEKKKITEERLKAYHEKKSKKAGPIAKSSVILDVKPWDDETNMDELEANVRSITMDGLVWGGGKRLPIGYGIHKLQIICVIEDDKVSVDDLIEQITDGFPDHCQSVDIHAFNKI